MALAAGHYDQSHLTAEFRAHGGLTPHTFRRALHYPGSASLAEPSDDAEQFFQDAAAALG